jgi:hypothetical protein
MIIQWLAGGGPPHPIIISLVALGSLSALGGLVLIRHRFAFLRREPNRQRTYAAAVWGLHVMAFLTWFVTVLVISGGP